MSRSPQALIEHQATKPQTVACALNDSPTGHPPRKTGERNFQVARWTEMPRGGHFAALEEPRLLAEDIRAFFRLLR